MGDSDLRPFSAGVVRADCHSLLSRWIEGKLGGEVIKDNNARTVWRVSVGEGAWFVKKFKTKGFVQRLRQLLRDRARHEFEVLRELRRRGMNAPEPVAWFKEGRGSTVVTRELAGVRLLRAWLSEASRGRSETRLLLSTLADFIRKLWSIGFLDRDLHAGNILLGWDRALPVFTVIDVHRARFKEDISSQDRDEGLAFLLLSLYTFLSRTDIFWFVKRVLQTDRLDKGRALSLWRIFQRVRENYFRDREKRCLRSGREFERARLADFSLWTVYARRDKGVWPVREEFASEVVKSLPGRSLVHHGPLFVKTYTYRSVPEGLFRVLFGSPALRIWTNAHALHVRGIDTPFCTSLTENPRASTVSGEWVEGAHPLYDYLSVKWPSAAYRERCEVLHALARFVRRLHTCGVFHHDLKANNILAREESDGTLRLWVIDLDRILLSREVSPRRRRCNLAQLNAAVGHAVSRADRMRFFRSYVGRDIVLWRDRRRIIQEIMRQTVARKHLWP